MALTKDFKDTIKNRIERDAAFREELLKEGIECLLAGDVDTGKAVLRDYINATMGFETLGEATDRSPKSLMRMFGPKGNPQAPFSSRTDRFSPPPADWQQQLSPEKLPMQPEA